VSVAGRILVLLLALGGAFVRPAFADEVDAS